LSSRTRTAGATVRIPNQRGRRSRQPFVVVMPERQSLTRVLLGLAGQALWDARRALAPTGLALLAFALTALLHALAWWSGLVLAPAAVAPVVWLAIVQRSAPATGSALAWRIGLVALTFLAAGWVATAAAFGPLAGPLELWWLLTLIAAQSAWLIVRRTH
jgi:hypothetical protein